MESSFDRLVRVGLAVAFIVAVPGSTRAQPSFPMTCDQAKSYLIMEGGSRAPEFAAGHGRLDVPPA